MTDPGSPYVFLSYASTERPRAVQIADALEASAVPVWIDREAIAGGTSWGSEIVEGIEHCAALVICCTPRAMQSRNVKQEIQLAWRFEKPYLPLLLEPVDFPQQVLYFLEGWQWVELLGAPPERWLPAVLKALKRLGIDGDQDSRRSTAAAGEAEASPEPAGEAARAEAAPSPPPTAPIAAPFSQDWEKGRDRGPNAGSPPPSPGALGARAPRIGGLCFTHMP